MHIGIYTFTYITWFGVPLYTELYVVVSQSRKVKKHWLNPLPTWR